MTEVTRRLKSYCEPDWEGARYGSIEELKELLLNKRIVKWTENFLLLEDGTKVTIEMSESDCCAWAGGEFKDVKSFKQDLGAYVIRMIGYKDSVRLSAAANTTEIIGNMWENPELLEVKQ